MKRKGGLVFYKKFTIGRHLLYSTAVSVPHINKPMMQGIPVSGDNNYWCLGRVLKIPT